MDATYASSGRRHIRTDLLKFVERHEGVRAVVDELHAAGVALLHRNVQRTGATVAREVRLGAGIEENLRAATQALLARYVEGGSKVEG